MAIAVAAAPAAGASVLNRVHIASSSIGSQSPRFRLALLGAGIQLSPMAPEAGVLMGAVQRHSSLTHPVGVSSICRGGQGRSGMTKPKAAISWSGGKDCCLAMLRAWDSFHIRGDGHDVQ